MTNEYQPESPTPLPYHLSTATLNAIHTHPVLSWTPAIEETYHSSISQIDREAIQKYPVQSFSTGLESFHKTIVEPYPICMTCRPPRQSSSPATFDGRTVWSMYLRPPQNQVCGSCWAYASVGELEARFCLATQTPWSDTQPFARIYPILCSTISSYRTKTPKQLFSPFVPLDIIEEQAKYGCYGDFLSSAMYFLFVTGVPQGECGLDTKGLTAHIYTPSSIPIDRSRAPMTCANEYSSTRNMCNYSTVNLGVFYGKGMKRFRGLLPYSYPTSSQDRIQAMEYDLVTYGPIATSFDCYSDFWTFFDEQPTAIYTRSPNAILISGHSVLLVGYGVDTVSNKSYWIVQNSWGTEWADGGYCRIQKGINECHVESQAIGIQVRLGLPQTLLFYASLSIRFELHPDASATIQKVFKSPFVPSTTLVSEFETFPENPILCQLLQCNNAFGHIDPNGYDIDVKWRFSGVQYIDTPSNSLSSYPRWKLYTWSTCYQFVVLLISLICLLIMCVVYSVGIR